MIKIGKPKPDAVVIVVPAMTLEERRQIFLAMDGAHRLAGWAAVRDAGSDDTEADGEGEAATRT